MFPQQIPLSYFSFCQSSSKQQILTIIPEKLLIKTTLFCQLLSATVILHHSLLPPAQSLFDSSSAYCSTHQFKCKNYIYKVFVSSISHTFCNVCLLMLSAVITVLLQRDCHKACLCAVTKRLIHCFNRGGHCALGLMWTALNDRLVSIIIA